MREILVKNRKILWILALTVGLAPFAPPHLYEKIKWIMGGGHGMQPMDYFDVVMHGSPWLLLLLSYVLQKGKT